MKQKNTEEAPAKEKSPEDFVKKYQALCEEYQMQIVVQPSYKNRDDGSWSTVLTTSIGKLPKQPK